MNVIIFSIIIIINNKNKPLKHLLIAYCFNVQPKRWERKFFSFTHNIIYDIAHSWLPTFYNVSVH